MGWTFGDLCLGDLFNTKAARWVKTSETEAICVMSALIGLGQIVPFDLARDVVLLWSAVLNAERCSHGGNDERKVSG